ncbi:hemagglutinin repeat-containing protein [Pseudomonas brassicacearum]|uniref:hemagglutinin repeat-containing protein n=2 Tax=Pseudomonas brassicacearum TaxID=930166 RepID=UPI00025FDBBB|nr:hemagglutinin repeat-containing protein [Pseudomonas brassicacearum]EIK69779.1 adhesin/hemagglutinin, HecA family [Pseudomonas fluorescens Q8r1-96]KAB0525599.1 filamentous hemagglutinin N-terminal domain-containing protein [Pseudomonas brassicacearum subsp. brassicacearum]NJP61913.1 filamentous hemagglutinin N-terminal domain-containing protein [Pseudomonas brassicacearum]SDP98969.1 filamentous hemagglutinin [Pseudomonas brassicacearum]
MDDRQYAFLARQPSAALKTRDAFWGMPKRGLAFLLANVMFWQPMWAQADGIVVSAPGTSLGQAGNGVPVVNIAKPNGSGLSHNQFKDYNVGSNGVILNNATNAAQSTQLGGIILGNPNLQGTAAKVILNEVNGGNPSQLRGYTEVAGQSAHVIVANPYGITCNGCGFINTPKATLTTGKPIIENGQVGRYQVDQGSVAIEGAGLNANNVDRFEIITRSAKINAEIQAKNLTIVAGRNDVNANTLNATARADDGSAKPELAIDSSALGGMYAGAIKLVGTEAGVGVKLDGKMVASGGDIQLDANGHLSLAQTAAAGAVDIDAKSLETRGQVYAGSRLRVKTQGDLTNQNNLVARDSIHLDSGGTLSNNGIIEAGVYADNSRNTTGDVTLIAKQLNNGGKTVIASRDLNITTTAALNNQGGTLSGQGKTTVTGNVVDNRNKGRILGNTELHLSADQVLNSQGGLINSQGLLTANLGHLENNAGELSSLNSATLVLGSLDNLTGLVMAGKNLDITNTGAINNRGGELSSQGVMTVRTASLDNSNKGTVAANGKLLVSATGAVNNAEKGLLASRAAEVEFDAASLNNAKGTLQGEGLVTVDVSGDIDNQGGSIIAKDAKLSVFATNLDNRGGVLSSVKAALEARTTGVLKNGYDVNRQGGTIQAQGLSIRALAGLFNDGGRMAAQAGDVVVTNAAADINNRNGGIYATGKVWITGRGMDNSGGGQVSASRIDFDLSGALNNNAGIIESQDSLDILAASLSNQKGQLRTLGQNSTTVFKIGGLFDNNDGTLETASNDVGFNTGSVQNVGGKLLHTGLGLFGISQANLGQAGGQLVTYGNLTVTADRWTNSTAIQAGHLVVNVDQLTQTATGQLLSTDSMVGRGSNWRVDGLIGSDGAIDLQLTGDYTGNGRLSSLGTLGLKAALISLEQNGSIAGGGNTTVVVDGVLNSYGRLTSAADLSVTAATLNNYGTLGSAGALGVSTGDLLNEHGLIFSGGNTSLRVNSLTNRYADIYSLGDLSIDRDGLGTRASRILNSSGTLQSDGNMRLAASTIDNVREILTTHDAGIYTASIREVACIPGDCDGPKQNHVWQIIQRDKFEVTAASAASSITTGGNLNIQGDTLTNRSSSIGVGGALTANLVSLNNIGIETGETETSRTFRSQRTRHPSGWRTAANDFTNKYWLQSPDYNANDLGGLEAAMSRFIGMTETEFLQFRTQTSTTDNQTYAAIIQAGGALDIPTQGDLNSGVVRGGYNYVGAGPRTDTQADNAFSTRISVNRQLPPSLTQQQVDPLALPGFDLPTGQNGLFRMSGDGSTTPTQSSGLTQVRGLPDRSFRANPQKYLIETNPALTDMRRFMSSDYLLTNLGYDPDTAAKRLGDGFYEQRLIQQAVIARTGQRFLDGQNSDDGMFKYLMNNAIASKDALNLSLGVSLTAEQVAALTHDIVWMETRTVNNQQVLVPVLYLAQANHRLAPNGALIQGSDVSLIAGKNLNNAGTLRASSNLRATAGDSLVNSGLLEAGNRLEALAGNDLTNRAGGVIAGRDVSVVAVAGDLTNERTITRHASGTGYKTEQREFADNAARIEASHDLTMGAGRDIANKGGVLKSGNDMGLQAVRDVNITSAEQVDSNTMGSGHRDQTITQNGSSATAGREMKVTAGQDLRVVASNVIAQSTLALTAGRDIAITSAANESHRSSQSKKVKSSSDLVRQQSSVIQSGGDLSAKAGQDLSLVASQLKGAKDVALDATRDISLLSATDETAEFYSKKSKGSFGRSKSEQRESYDSTNVASVVEAGQDLTVNTSQAAGGGVTLDGGRNVTVIGSQLNAGNDLVVGATGDVAVLSGIEEHGSYSKKTKSGFLGLSKSGKSELKTTASQVASELEAGNDVVLVAGNDLRLRASKTTAGNDVELRAGLVKDSGDINLVAANDTAYSHSEQYKKKTGLSVSGGFLSFSSAKESGRIAQSSTSVGSQVTADRDATLQAERDINLVGSGIDAGRNVSLNAGRDVNVLAAQNSRSERDWEKNKQAGIGVSSDANGINFFAGADSLKNKNRLEQQTAAASQISAGQDVAINAQRDINQTGSDLRATRDIGLTAGRNINIDAARETQLTEQEREASRNGLGISFNHNYGNTKDAVNGAGKGENGVSKASSTLKGIDAVAQFVNGPTVDVKYGNSTQTSSQQVIEQTNRASTFDAGNDLNLNAGNDVTVKGGQLKAGRDINVKGRDVTLDVAKGSVSQESTDRQSWSGIHGGTSGGFKLGVGGSYGVATEDGVHGSSTATQVAAGRDVNVDARHDINLVGTQVKAGRDIALDAGNELNIRSAQNASDSESNRHNGGGEGGLTFGSQGVGVYVSVNIGKGNLDREGSRQQEAYLYAGNRLGFTSGKDTNISGATLRGDEVVGRVGGDLNVSSVPDTGEVKGKEFDLSVTATFGPGAGVSGSVGYGQTTGETNWVEQQTSITGKNKVDIRTEDHTQLDGALIAADNGNLKLDTGTLGFSDIAGKDKEHGYYLNVGGSYSKGGGGAQDSSQVGKGEKDKNGWSISGWEYEKDRQQTVRATVGAGEVVVRNDSKTGADSTAGLNRDVSKAYEITKDDESRTDLYVTKSSVDAVMDTSGTVTAWKNSIKSYPDSSLKAYEDALKLVNGPVQAAGQVWNSIQAQRVSIEEVPASARAALGDEVALNVAKNLVRNGKDPDDIAKLEPKDVIAIQYFADLFTTFAKQQESCGATGDCASGDEGQKDPVHYVDADGNSMIVNFKPLVPSTSGGNVLVQADALQTYLDKLNPAQAQLVRLGIQAVMGPVKAAVSLAGNVVVDKLFGDKIADAKDALSKSLASELSGKSKDDLEHSDDRFKELSKLGATTQKGDVYVRGATTLLDIALGIATNAAGSVAGKAIGIVGKGSSDGVTKGRDELGGGPKDPDWDKKFAENPPKGWVETGGAKGPDQALPNNQRLLSGTPGQVTGGSSTKLGQNLNQAMGRNRTDSWAGYQAQHLIPSELKNHPILKKVGIDLDDSSNGIFLPASKAKPEGAISGMPRHTGSHPNYTEAVRKSLNELDRNLPVEQLQKQVFDLQGRLRNVTGSGMPVRNVDGAKTEVWLKWLGK